MVSETGEMGRLARMAIGMCNSILISAVMLRTFFSATGTGAILIRVKGLGQTPWDVFLRSKDGGSE
jgi:hypothetical protein